MMPIVEKAVAFECGGDQMVGILHVPQSASEIALVIVVGGPQYRIGSHRMFVQLARTVASSGHTVLRFDARGMGDSGGARAPFDRLTADIGAAIDAVQAAVPDVHQVALWGLCDGASAALLYWDDTHDPRVRAMCLANPWVRSDASLARTHVKHYYGQRLLQREFWAKLLTGEVGSTAARGFLRSIMQAGQRRPERDESFQSRMARAWKEFDGRLLLLCSGHDYTAKEFFQFVSEAPAWREAMARQGLIRHDLNAADHTFSASSQRVLMESYTAKWLGEFAASSSVA